MSHDPNAPIEVEYVDGTKFTLPSLSQLGAEQALMEAEADGILADMGLSWGDFIIPLEDES